jgi:hypothetical protein
MLLKGSDVPKMKNNNVKGKDDAQSIAKINDMKKHKSSMSYNGSEGIRDS